MKARQMALTRDLVALVHRVLEDPGPEPGLVYHREDDYDAIVQAMLATASGGPGCVALRLWLTDLEA